MSRPEAELLGSRAGKRLRGFCWQAVPGKGGLGEQVVPMEQSLRAV